MIQPETSPIGLKPLGLKPMVKQVAVGMACASYWRGAWYFLDDHLFPESTLNSAVSSLGLGTVGLAVCQGVAGASFSALPWKQQRLRFPPFVVRFGALYVVSTSCVLVWRGAWLLCDVAYEEAARYYYAWNFDRYTSLSTREPVGDAERNKTSTRNPTHRRLTLVREEDVSFSSSAPVIRATDPHHRTVSGLLSHGLALVGLLCVGRFASVLAPPARASIAKDAALYAKTPTEYIKTANWQFQKTK